MTTPLEREILTHYYCYPGEFRGGRANWSEHMHGLIRRYIAYGLLKQVVEDGHSKIVANQPALQAYMDALAKVPFPVQQWVVPE